MKNQNTLRAAATVVEPAPLLESIDNHQGFVETELMKSELDKRMLLFRLSDAAARIRDESALIARSGFTDSATRLLRTLGEAIEEQRLALGADAREEESK